MTRSRDVDTIARVTCHAFSLDPGIDFLNHGSFGACPREVLAAQARLRDQLEAEPVRFFVRELEPLLAGARAALGAFVGADPDDLAFVPNATAGVNEVLRSLRFDRGDELVTTDHAYNACKNALDFVADRAGARVVVAHVPFPIDDPDEVVGAVVAAVGPRTRLALVDHVTSPTGLVLPIAAIVRALETGTYRLADVRSRAAETRARLADPIAISILGTLAIVAAAALAFALLGVLAASWAAGRVRRGEVATLLALGLERRGLLLLVVIEEAFPMAAGLAGGVALGAALGIAVLPSMIRAPHRMPRVPGRPPHVAGGVDG